jgi:hypothetical protein
MAVSSSNAASIALSLTGTIKQSAPRIIRRSSVTLYFDVVVLLTQFQASDSDRHSQPNAAPHAADRWSKGGMGLPCSLLHAQLGCFVEHCKFPLHGGSGLAVPPHPEGNLLPNDYASIVLSGIVTLLEKALITTKLSVGFEIFLPYLTKGNHSLLPLVPMLQ